MTTNQLRRLARVVAALVAGVAFIVAGMTGGALFSRPAKAAEVVPAVKASATTTITVTGGAADTYTAYELFSATDLGSDLYSYTINESFRSAIIAGLDAAGASVADDADSATIQAAIAGLDSSAMTTFARTVTQNLPADATGTQSEASGDDAVIAVEPGYYLVVQTSSPADGDAASATIVSTAGNAGVTVSPKKDTPTLVKKVQEKNDSAATGTTNPTGWQDGADYDIGDAVPYQLTATLPSSESAFAAYQTYALTFHDTQSAGLTFNADSVAVSVNGTTIPATDANGHVNYTVTSNSDGSALADGCTFEVALSDVKSLTAADGSSVVVNAGDAVVVNYTSTLNSGAVIGSTGNPNEALLEFSNVPNSTTNPTGKTPKDKVTVFTFKAVVNKTDGHGNPLKGAGFTLEKYDAVNSTWNTVQTIAAGDATTFTYSGLDSGTYRLTESTTPSGYNTASPIVFKVVGTYDTDSDDPQLTGLKVMSEDGTQELTSFTVDSAAGTATTTVVNEQGTKLPSTGAAGTKVLYALGIALVLAALAGLIAMTLRRRDA
ncbi:isopeptide-forming domain-containing fimbrial protein [Bifidobacterium choloepi]|uniref:Isopeptide-forming domain-containing fimbrial protein n=1 Tax=Bifidobacterium choloepi TaxID=2614131 RepID=A0A6I5NIX2_9BIFI|nr:isopeptide-forming domain-containing fimbrial protein [Bifidobacterium choloepi]NEG70333.1 isopeptide-forming domain-containing fimbrial protein [Bifidobacterium choloepi]